MAVGVSRRDESTAMKSKKRFFLGLVATLLLSIGLTQAAERLDPLSKSSMSAPLSGEPAPDCVATCHLIDDNKSDTHLS